MQIQIWHNSQYTWIFAKHPPATKKLILSVHIRPLQAQQAYLILPVRVGYPSLLSLAPPPAADSTQHLAPGSTLGQGEPLLCQHVSVFDQFSSTSSFCDPHSKDISQVLLCLISLGLIIKTFVFFPQYWLLFHYCFSHVPWALYYKAKLIA